MAKIGDIVRIEQETDPQGQELAEQKEIQRLNKIYAGLPPKQKAIAEGLIIQAARLRVSLDLLAADIRENGLTEMFRQSDKVEPYTRERAATQIFAKMDKNYQGIISQLNKMVPAEDEPDDDLTEFKRG